MFFNYKNYINTNTNRNAVKDAINNLKSIISDKNDLYQSSDEYDSSDSKSLSPMYKKEDKEELGEFELSPMYKKEDEYKSNEFRLSELYKSNTTDRDDLDYSNRFFNFLRSREYTNNYDNYGLYNPDISFILKYDNETVVPETNTILVDEKGLYNDRFFLYIPRKYFGKKYNNIVIYRKSMYSIPFNTTETLSIDCRFFREYNGFIIIPITLKKKDTRGFLGRIEL